MRRKSPKTLRGWAAKYRRDMKALVAAQAAAVSELARYKAAEGFRKLREQVNWSDYDRAVDQTTRAERELFEASPAYKRYQQLREDRERRGTGDWRLKRGDWRTP